MNISAKRWTHKHTGALVFTAIVLLISGIFFRDIVTTSAQSSQCPYGFQLGGLPATTTSPTGGLLQLNLATPNSTAYSTTRVEFRANSLVLGLGKNSTINPYSFGMPLQTQYLPNGAYSVNAEVQLSNGYKCLTVPIPVNIYNPTQITNTFVINTSPSSWQGGTNVSLTFTAEISPYGGVVLNDYALVSWSTTIGSLTPDGRSARFSSGPTAGTGKITVKVQYAGRVTEKIIGVTVANTQQTNTTTQNTATSTTSAQNTTSTNTAPQTSTQTAARTASIASDPNLQTCIEASIGKERFAQINGGLARPTQEELTKINACFSKVNYVIPSNFAPVAPTQLPELPKTTVATIASLKNDSKTVGDKKKDVLVFSGKAKPNSLVVLYVFSEPLVLTTTANSNGDWSYSLEDPLEEGKHEAYAVVDRGDGQYEKTDPFSFAIGRAQASAENPNGLSTQLVGTQTPTQSNRNILIYVFGVIAIVLIVALIVLIILRKRRAKHIPPTGPPTTFTPTIQPPSSPYSSNGPGV